MDIAQWRKLTDLALGEIMSTPTEEQSEILPPETAETTETTDQKTINNTYLTGENLTLLNKFLIPTELHSPLPDKL